MCRYTDIFIRIFLLKYDSCTVVYTEIMSGNISGILQMMTLYASMQNFSKFRFRIALWPVIYDYHYIYIYYSAVLC